MLTKIMVVLCLIGIIIICSCAPNPTSPGVQGEVSIHDIQGCAHNSPYNGKTVRNVQGIVTSKNSAGFYLQDNHPDTLDCTSEAIYVFTKIYPDVLPGDELTVSGNVMEFRPGNLEDQNLSITEIINPEIKLQSKGNKLPVPIIIGDGGRKIPGEIIDDDSFTNFDPVSDGLDFFESIESMMIKIESGLVVGPRNQFNEIVIIPPSALESNLVSESRALLARETDFNSERIILNLNDSNQEKINTGSELTTPVVGIMDYSFGNYKLNVFGRVNFTVAVPEYSQMAPQPGSLTIATLNVENLSKWDAPSKFRKIAGIIVNELGSPDVVILHEILDDSGIEDDGVVSATLTIQMLLDAVIKNEGPDYKYSALNPVNNSDGGIKGGNIRSVILYRIDNGISLVEEDLLGLLKENPIRIGSESWKFDGTRKPLLSLFLKNGQKFIVIAVHLTSRAADSPLFGAIQPMEKPEEEKRILQAEYIHEYVEELTKEYAGTRIIVAGDMNDDPWSSTINALQGTALFNLGNTIPEKERYSYVLDGNAIQLDYIFTLRTEKLPLDKFQILHINSLFDYTLQVSDHDAVIASIDLQTR